MHRGGSLVSDSSGFTLPKLPGLEGRTLRCDA